MRRVLVAAALTLALGCASTVQRPVRNVSPRRHPNIAAAQRYIQEAFDRIVRAQRANEWDMNGHAQKAKALLDQANNELKEAAEAANENAR